ncbi:MAG: ergothioneine biosynthesis protein EgtB [Pyrinomonadaceae bacterium]
MQATATGEERGLLDHYEHVRAYTEQLCKPLEIEDYIPQPSVDVSPAKWNIAHTTWFFEEMILKRSTPGYCEFDPQFGFLFNSYYNSLGERTLRDRRGDLSRPTVKRVFEYRKHVDSEMRSLLSRDMHPDLRELVILGLNHEQQHQELFITDLKFTFAQNPTFPVYRSEFHPEESPEDSRKEWLTNPSGISEIGYGGDGFCFDNELSRHKVWLDEFQLSTTLVRNREWIEFMHAGSYDDPLLWHSDGWDWVQRETVTAPLYWHGAGDGWKHYTLAGLRDLPLEAPVCHISWYEASAFAEWSGMRLPTEFEWEAASSQFNWELRWEWTGSAYLPYPGFKKPGGAVGEYNGKFMINQMVLRGASVATPAGHSRATYRNFFHPHLRWQFTGLRLAK